MTSPPQIGPTSGASAFGPSPACWPSGACKMKLDFFNDSGSRGVSWFEGRTQRSLRKEEK